ncbi:MAG: hypothetical protein NWS31_03370 [Crocinitomicaceae bacterium]|nr:hypothetical protein [Crocinitomicaceae bacterium]MDP4739926.1 hypothetical protein [Crocinitomicaceae bacterium]MDP4800201.1 hypothetical protein [Crocinitomicaceae bacterium]MDP4806742.1 hypothetical protein [Crocinitomicaceae bacterium]MDP4868133.1 hypothetical protein [Crocinitomicaceae bacterium]
MERLILLLLFFSVGVLRADMLPTELRFTLKQVPTRSDQYTVLELEIKNTSALHNSILVPGHPQLGMGLFEVYAYERAETMKWTLDTTYSLVLPDSAAVDKKYMQFWSLDPGESFKQLFVINEPPSSGRAYQIKYQPHVCEDFFKYAFRWYDGEGEPTDAAIDGDQRFAYQGPMFSDLCDVYAQISEVEIQDHKSKDYYNGNWRQVQHQVKRSMKHPQTWPVLSAQLYSQTILASLPSYSHQYIVVESKAGIYTVSLGYQIGKIRRVRSFLAKIAHLCGARRVFWRTSSSKAIKLTYFQITPFQ